MVCVCPIALVASLCTHSGKGGGALAETPPAGGVASVRVRPAWTARARGGSAGSQQQGKQEGWVCAHARQRRFMSERTPDNYHL